MFKRVGCMVLVSRRCARCTTPVFDAPIHSAIACGKWRYSTGTPLSPCTHTALFLDSVSLLKLFQEEKKELPTLSETVLPPFTSQQVRGKSFHGVTPLAVEKCDEFPRKTSKHARPV